MTAALTWIPESPEEAAALLPRFEGFAKIQGMILCRVLGLPALRGAVLDPANTDGLAEAFRAVTALSPDRYLLRHDKNPESGHYPQGGYIVSNEELAGEIEWYRAHERMLILFEPAHPLDNGYSAGVTIAADGVATLELVGPGFDASDLNRGYITPQEVYQFLLDGESHTRKISHTVTNGMAYRQAKRLRLRKLALKFVLRRKYLEEESEDLDPAATADLVVDKLLPKYPIVSHLLGEQGYARAPASFVRRLCRYAETVATFEAPRRRFLALSASEVFHGKRDAVWDIVFPERKFAATRAGPT
jgi:hypothetical protein